MYICNTYAHRLYMNPVAIQIATIEFLAAIAWGENFVFQVLA